GPFSFLPIKKRLLFVGAGANTGLIRQLMGASLNVMSMVSDEAKSDICQWTISTVNGSASFLSL
ncbi:TPA: hypothetical protein ACJI8J_003287, partial [Kluyvera georgiana]